MCDCHVWLNLDHSWINDQLEPRREASWYQQRDTAGSAYYNAPAITTQDMVGDIDNIGSWLNDSFIDRLIN